MKILKVWEGKKLHKVYPYATRWQVIKWKMGILIRKAVIGAFVLGLIVSAFKVGSTFFGKTVYAQVDKVVTVDNLSEKIEQIKQEALDGISKCESAGHSEDEGIIIFDTNNRASIGQFQFQKATVIHYYKTLYNQDITPKDAVLIALDSTKARKLAYDVIFTTDKGLTNWINCSNKIGLRQTLDLIGKLEK